MPQRDRVDGGRALGGDETSTLIGVSGDQLVAPLITGLSIMPASTPQLVAIVL